jgi:hypothetical protein
MQNKTCHRNKICLQNVCNSMQMDFKLKYKTNGTINHYKTCLKVKFASVGVDHTFFLAIKYEFIWSLLVISTQEIWSYFSLTWKLLFKMETKMKRSTWYNLWAFNKPMLNVNFIVFSSICMDFIMHHSSETWSSIPFS